MTSRCGSIRTGRAPMSTAQPAYKKLGKLDKTLADENEAIRRDAKVPEYFDNRGLADAAMGDHDKAIADYEQAIRMEQRASFFANRGDSYQYKDELGTAPNYFPAQNS
jgi:tetratricopeptide (TPR) repeat protein